MKVRSFKTENQYSLKELNTKTKREETKREERS